jgi:hypothetical protein
MTGFLARKDEMNSSRVSAGVLAAALLAGLLLHDRPASAQGGPLPVPTDLAASVQPGMRPEVELTWHAPNGAWFFRVYRSLNDSLHWQFLAPAPDRAFHDRGVFFPNRYYYRVTSAAYRDSGLVESSPSFAVMAALTPPPKPHGMLRGSVHAEAGGVPVPNACVRPYLEGSGSAGPAPIITDPAGFFEAEIDTGTYRIRFEPPHEGPGEPSLLGEWFDNAGRPEDATPVHIGQADTVTLGIVLSAPHEGQLVDASGTVADSAGQPLAGATVAFLRPFQVPDYPPGDHRGHAENRTLPGIGYTEGIIWTGFTDGLGQFTAHVPDSLRYILVAGKSGFLPEYALERSDPSEADVLHLFGDTTGITFTLDPVPAAPGAVQGVVQDSIGVRVPSRVILFPRPPGTHPGARFVHTDSLGTFSLPGVVEGTYTVMAVPFSEYVPSYYRAGSYGVTNWEEADSIVVTTTSSGNIVGTVEIAARGLTLFSGNLRTSEGEPLAGGTVVGRNAAGEVLGFGISDGSGAYAVESIESGIVDVSAGKYGFLDVLNSFTIPPSTFIVPNVDFSLTPGPVTGVERERPLPAAPYLAQNFPNPFNPATTIRYELSSASQVTVKVYSVLGREMGALVAGREEAGSKSVVLAANDWPTGVYFVRLTVQPLAGGAPYSSVRKILLLK